MTATNTSVLIVGAGIGGLTAAIALQRAGIAVRVLEQAPALGEVGAGVSLWPNAVNALRGLGLGDDVQWAGTRVRRTDLMTSRGRLIHDSSTDAVEARFGAPVVMIHRAELHAILRSALDPDIVQLGAAVHAVEHDRAGVRVHHSGGDALRADVLVGADGLRSVVRSALLDDGPPAYSGLSAWRAVVTVTDAVAARVTGSETWGQGSIFGMQRLPGNRVYWYAGTRAPEGGRATPDQLDRFASWHDPIPELLAATPASALLNHGLYDRRPTPSITSGRVALLGDAAHPMLPYLGQGACQAIVDGVVLAQALGDDPDPASALASYARRRLSQTSAAVTQSRLVARAAHVRPRPAAALRNALLRSTPPSSALKRLEPILSSDAAPARQS